MGIMQYNKNATDRAKEDIKAALKTLNDHLLTRTYLVGECVTLADIAVACTLLSLYKQVLDPSFRKPFMNVTRWIPSLTSARLRLLSTGSGRAKMQRAENSTRARSSSNRPNFPIDNSKF